MNNLLRTYNDLYEDKSKWKYYSKLEGDIPFNSFEAARHFIERFIQLSGKSHENSLYENIQKLDEDRIKHIVSVFFFGTSIYYSVSSIRSSIDRVVSRYQKQNPASRIEFSFIWFLICLFHDLGYDIEENKKFSDFEDFISDKVKYFLNKSVGVPQLYENTYKNYFNYRLKSFCPNIRKPDHGICGGILLFSELNMILLKKQCNIKTEGLSWNDKLKNIYKFASWVILSHNIFFIRQGDCSESEYIENNLQDLILSKDDKPKVNYKKHSFLYLFMLVDSIDPVKIFGDFSILQHINIETSENEIKISIHDRVKREIYFQKVNNLKEWLIPDIIEEGETIRILIS